MKKTVFAFFLFLFAFCVFGQSVDLNSGIIRELAGSVELKKPGSTVFSQASAGDIISRDTIISTGFKSTALVELGNTIISVRPLTRLSLVEISASGNTETINVNLQAGRVRVEVNPPAGTRASMSISSPVATASVRGTSFEFDTRNLYVSSGTVVFAGNRGQSRIVNRGSQSRVEPDGSTADPVKTRNERLRPSAPAGSETNGGRAGDTSNPTGLITIKLDYTGKN